MEGFAILKHVFIPQYVPTTDNCPSHLSKRRKRKKYVWVVQVKTGQDLSGLVGQVEQVDGWKSTGPIFYLYS